MLSINTNLSSLIAQNSMKTSSFKLDTAIERMTTGYKINHAKDNAANYAIATNMSTKINSLMVAEDNVAQGLDLISTAESTLNILETRVTRLRDLQEQASNGTYGEDSLKAINSEANALIDEINRLYNNGIHLFNNTEIEETNLVQTMMSLERTSIEVEGTGEFIKEIQIRDTSDMSKFGDIEISEEITGGVYSISSASELAKLATMANNGLIKGGEFVLANTIDLSTYTDWIPIGSEGNPFMGTFDGNGFIIVNLTITSSSSKQRGLFGYVQNAVLKNIALENVNIVGSNRVAPLAAVLYESTTENCYATGEVNGSLYNVAGLVGWAYGAEILDSYSTCNVNGDDTVGGIVGTIHTTTSIKRCFATGNLSGSLATGGICGATNKFNSIEPNITIEDCYFIGTTSLTRHQTAGVLALNRYKAQISNCYSKGNIDSSVNYSGQIVGQNSGSLTINDSYALNNNYVGDGAATISNTIVIPSEVTPYSYTLVSPILEKNTIPEPDSTPTPDTGGESFEGSGNSGERAPITGMIIMQVGLGADSNSQIEVDVSFKLGAVNGLRNIGLDTSTDYLTQIDSVLADIREKQTHLGAASNRLESALDEISIQYENLVSSRSTIRDADMAEVSSQYIQQQILQQASATLLATANQAPSIALQLI